MLKAHERPAYAQSCERPVHAMSAWDMLNSCELLSIRGHARSHERLLESMLILMSAY